MKSYKVLTKEKKRKIVAEVKMMLHAHRDTLRNMYKWDKKMGKKSYDPKEVSFRCNEGFHGEAFGIMRGLEVLGYGYFGPCNRHALEMPYWDKSAGDKKVTVPEHNLKWWFTKLESAVLEEENFKGNHQCDWCLNKYGKDDVRFLLDGGIQIKYYDNEDKGGK